MASKTRRNAGTTAHLPTKTRPPARARTSTRRQAAAGAKTRSRQKPRHRRKPSEGIGTWLKAGAVLAGLVVAGLVVIYFTSGTGSVATDQRGSASGQTNLNTTAHAGCPYGPGTAVKDLPQAQAVAQALGISPDALQSDFDAGKSIPQLAQDQHVSLETVNTAYLSGVKAFLDSQVQCGGMSQADVERLYQQEQQGVPQGIYGSLPPGASSAGSGYGG
jgi:hypothetical protein